MKSALKDSVINESVLMNDILTINNILSLGIISDADFITCYNKLKMDGGNINANMDNIIPDLLSTYQFMISLNRMNNFEYLEEQKRYISSLCKDDGIYVLDKNSKEVKDVSVIVYGNAINQFEIGGNLQ